MRIKKTVLYHLKMKLVSPFETSFGRQTERECILVELHSDGLVGYGECVTDRNPFYSYETIQTARHILVDFIIPKLMQNEISEIIDYQNSIMGIRGHLMAKASVEMALWDLLGKKRNLSLKQMLGGIYETVSVGVSIGIQASISQLLDTIDKYLMEGYQRVKIKIKPGRTVKETHAVRIRYPELLLQVDANSAFSLENTTELKKIDDLDLLLIEQPLADDDLWDHSKLQKMLDTPICLDESICSSEDARKAIEMQACKVINIKSGRVGGISEAISIHNICIERNIPVWCGGMLETGVGRAANLALASLENFRLPGDISGTNRYYSHDITNEVFTINQDSQIEVPDGHGLGISINDDLLKRVSISKMEIQL